MWGPAPVGLVVWLFGVFLAMPHDIRNLSSSTRDQTHTPSIESVES